MDFYRFFFEDKFVKCFVISQIMAYFAPFLVCDFIKQKKNEIGSYH